jgi:arsenite/tail-anchored protein-transporting ATPase
VLVVSTDPAHSLGDALGTPLTASPRSVPGASRLHAVELDADRALARWLSARRRRLADLVERGTYLDDEDVERFLGLSLPGVDELVGLLELVRLAAAQPWDLIVVDTAPTGHTLRLVRTPEMLRRIASVLDTMQAKHRYLEESLTGRHAPDGAEALIDEIATDARALDALLTDRTRSSFVWVTLPERLAVAEARDGVRELEHAGIAVDEVVVNRVDPPPRAPCAFCRARSAFEGAMVKDIRSAFRGRRLRVMPAEDSEPRGVTALARVGRRLARPGSDGWRSPVGSANSHAAVGSASLRGAAKSVKAPARADDLSSGATGTWLDIVSPPGTRLLLLGGKGGVGKTTCAAAAALALAARHPDRRVLLLSTDPAHSLGDVLETTLDDDERPVPGAPANLRARELDADRAWQVRRRRYEKAVDEAFGGLFRHPGIDATFDRAVARELLDLAPPGLDELFGVLAVIDGLFRRQAPYDLVVVDTAPTGHALRLLGTIGIARAWVRALLQLALKYRSVIGLGDFAADLVEVSRDLRELETLLADHTRARFVCVTRAAELPRLETRRLLHALRRSRVAAPVLIVNAVRQPGCRRCTLAERAERRQLQALAASQRGRNHAAMIVAPAVAPPPSGTRGLDRWTHGWRVREGRR